MAEPATSVEHELALLEFQMALETAKRTADVVLIAGNTHEYLNRIGHVLGAQVAGACVLIQTGLSCVMLSPTEETSDSMAELLRQEMERAELTLVDFSKSLQDYETDPIFFPSSPRPPVPRQIGRPMAAKGQSKQLQRKTLPCNRY